MHKGDVMINHDLIEELAGLLNVDTQESGRLLNAFFSAMVTGLLAERKLSVKGLGSFSVSHVPLKKKIMHQELPTLLLVIN